MTSPHTMALPALTEAGLSRYMNEVNQLPYLTEEEELALANRWKNEKDIEAAHKLVTSHLRLVVKLAFGYRGYGLPLMELIAEGNIGLMQAVKKFSPEKGFRLATYAIWWIKASIQEYILRSWSLVKIGTTAAQKKLFFNLRRLKRKLNKLDNTSLAPHEIKTIAHELNVSEGDVVEMDSRLGHDQSLNAPAFSSEDDHASGELIDYLEEDKESHEELLANHADMSYKQHLFQKALTTLNTREKDIITARRLKETPTTLEDLSTTYHISRERVRQIEVRALEKLQAYIAGQQI